MKHAKTRAHANAGANPFSTAATQFVDGFGNSAHQVIEAWRAGSDRLGDFAGSRWDSAFEQSKSQLDAETRKNAQHAREVFGGYYSRGVEMTAAGAVVAVDTVVQVARAAIERASAWQQVRA